MNLMMIGRLYEKIADIPAGSTPATAVITAEPIVLVSTKSFRDGIASTIYFVIPGQGNSDERDVGMWPATVCERGEGGSMR